MAALFPSYANTLRSPQQSSNTFSQVGGFPKQRNVFIIRFVPKNTFAFSALGNLTFAAKTIERPKFSTKTEELNQYNKKRHIFTGYKIEPIKVSFYDSADCSAQNMWTIYSRYYFGDFNNQSISPTGTNQSFAYDATSPFFRDFAGQGFGFTAQNGGGDSDAMYFFDHIEIYHFYDGYYDQFNLANPRIASYDPDELDYASSEISMVNMSIVYESVNYFQQQPVFGAQFPEFESAFFGDPVNVPGGYYSSVSMPTISSLVPGYASIASLLNGGNGYTPNPLNFRFNGSLTGGGLGLFGNFTFGPSGALGAASLATMALGNVGLSSALSMGSSGSSLGGGINPSISTGFNGQVANAASATVSSAATSTNGYTPPTNAPGYSHASSVTQASIAGQAIGGTGATATTNGLALSSASIGVLNSNSTGTSQFGYRSVPPSSVAAYSYSKGNAAPALPSPAPQNAYGGEGLA